MIKIVLKTESLIKNFDFLNSKWNIVWPCLKKDAYWLWIINVLNILSEKNINTICTDSIVDFIKIRKYFFWDILYFWDINIETIKNCAKYNVIPTIYSNQQIKYIKIFKKVFIELNNWLNRYWCNPDLIEILITNIIKEWIDVNGILVHFPEQSLNSLNKNLETYQYILNLKKKYSIEYISALSTETICKYDNFPENVIRPWIWLYWYFSHKDDYSYKLKNTLFISTNISNVRNLKKWENIWYWILNRCKKDTQIAIIPIWYADWIMKISEWVWYVFIWNKKCKIISISMSCSFIDVSNLTVSLWDIVEIVWNNISLYDWWNWSMTIPQEIMLWFCRGKDVDIKID